MRLNRTFITLLIQAIKNAGSYHPDECLHFVEESMTLEEVKVAREFLLWVVQNGRTFGHGNIQAVYSDWHRMVENKKPVIKRRNGYDRLAIDAKFPSGGLFKFSITRSGDNLTLGGSSEPELAQQQQRTVAEWLKERQGESHGQRIDRVAAILADCLSVDHLCSKIRNEAKAQEDAAEAADSAPKA